jgi:hypothetical protein
LLGGVDSLLTDVTTLIKAPARFSKLSTYQERLDIFNALNSIKNYIDNPYYSDLHPCLDKLKQAIRPFVTSVNKLSTPSNNPS